MKRRRCPGALTYARSAEAIRNGDLQALTDLLRENPALATARIDGQRTSAARGDGLAGHFPNGVATVGMLIEHGADVNAPFIGHHRETPLHWAASSDDVAVLDALLDHGADIEARGGGHRRRDPLSDAVAFGQWNAARRLVERGAHASLWEAAALGMMDRVEGVFCHAKPQARRGHQRFLVRMPWRAASDGRISSGAGRGSELGRA